MHVCGEGCRSQSAWNAEDMTTIASDKGLTRSTISRSSEGPQRVDGEEEIFEEVRHLPSTIYRQPEIQPKLIHLLSMGLVRRLR